MDEYNTTEEDPRKRLKRCECGHNYVMWNKYQHDQSTHHKLYVMKKDNIEITIEKPARMCSKKDKNDRIHGRWSTNRHDACPKCHISNPPDTIDTSTKYETIDVSTEHETRIHINHRHADVYIFHKNKSQED
jgi:acetone carboxylase gamma subunit